MHETEPREIFQDREFEFGLRSLAIVVLNAQQDASVAIVRGAPDIQRVHHMPKVEVAGGRRRKPCQHAPIRIPPAPFEVRIRPVTFAKRSPDTGLAYKPSRP